MMTIKTRNRCCKNAPESVYYNEFNGIFQCHSCGVHYALAGLRSSWWLPLFVALIFLLAFVFGHLSTYAQSDTCANGDRLILNTSLNRYQCVAPGSQPAGTGTTMLIANASVTGTTVNRLAKLTGAPSTAVITATLDTENAIGIVSSGAGTTGNATITILGQASCEFDNGTTAGDYFTISAITAGKCHDAGSAFPNTGATYGRVLSTNGGAGTYVVELMTPDIAFQNAGNGKSRPGGSDTFVQFNDSNTFGGDSGFVYNKTTDTITLSGAFNPANGSTQAIATIGTPWGSGFFDNLNTNAANGYRWNSAGVSGGILRDSGPFGSSPRGGILDFSDSANGGATIALRATTPAQITADQNNYSTALGFLQRWSSDATRTVTGFVPIAATSNKNGQIHRIVNVGSNNIVISNQNASSTAANRFLTTTTQDITLLPDEYADCVYDSTVTRWRCDTVLRTLTATATLDFGALAAIGCEDLTVTVTGAASGDVVSLGVPNGSVVANSSYSAWVSSANTVSVRFCALVSGDPASGTFRVDVTKH